MNILFLNLANEADWGGGERWTVNTAEGLARREHTVLFVGRKRTGIMDSATALGLETDQAPVGADYAPETVLAVNRIFQRFKPDVLVVHHNKDVRTGGVAAKLAGIPVVHRNGFPILRNNLRHRLSNKLTDRILTNSNRIKDHYLSFGWFDSKKIDVVPNGIQYDNFPNIRAMTNNLESLEASRSIRESWGVGQDDLVAVFAGRLTGVKRVSDLLEVFARDKSNHWRLVVMGRGDHEDDLKQKVNKEALAEKVIFTGFKQDASRKLFAADLVVLPSEEEGMPNSLMEAMAQRVPVAATPVGDVPYLLDDGKAGWLVPVGDIDAWVELFRNLERSPGTLDSMGENGRKRVQSEFSFERMLDGVEESLEKAIRQHG